MTSNQLFILFATALQLSAATIHTDFEGGSLGQIEKVSPTHFRLAVKGESDQDGRNRQANWYYFRVDGASSQPLTLDMVNLPGEYNYRPNRGAVTKDTPPVISYDGIHWEHVKTYDYDPKEPKLILHIEPAKATFWIAHCAPYTNENLARLRNKIRHNPDFREQVIGKTVRGRDLVLWTITHGNSKSKKTIWLMFRQHSWESGSSWVGEGAVRTLLASESKKLRNDIVWKILPLCDPDGVARGGVRFNVNGYDLNRNWDVVDPIKMPEITAQRNAIKQWLDAGNHIDLLLSLHNTETGEYLEGPPGGGHKGEFKPLAQRAFQILSQETTFAPTRPLIYAEETTTPGKAGRMDVTQGLYRDFGIPGFIMEQRISYNQKLGRLPEVADRLKFGGELVRALAQAVAQ
ncbi:MAG TPA: M14-type cytosolic carboxypeptidase [Bryobacteraceae bacterium]